MAAEGVTGPVVAFTATHRVNYMQETLESWSQVRGIETAHLIFRCEPGFPDMVEACQQATFGASLEVIVNPAVYGVLSNPWHAVESGFRTGADFVIVGEDDTIVSTDILEFYSWAAETYRDDQQVLTVCAHMYDAQGGFADVLRAHGYGAWIWGLWRDRWFGKLRDDWDHDYRYKGWDWRIAEHWMRDEGYVCICPAMSRSQDIGQFGGVHALPSDFGRAQSRCFVPDIPPQQYREIGAL